MRIEETRTFAELQSFAGEWQVLQAQCPTLTPFQTWEWNSLWWKHFGGRKRLHLLRFYAPDTDALCGIVPLCLTSTYGLPLRRLTWIANGISDYLTIVAPPEHEEEVMARFLGYLSENGTAWGYADLPQLPANCPLLTAPLPTNLERTVLPQEPCPSLVLPENWEALLKLLGKKMRSNLGYYDRLLLRTFPDAQYELADSTTLQEGMTALFDLHQRRWHARWLPGVLGNPRVQAFHRELAHCFLERGWLRLHLLRAEGRVRAVLYCFACGGRTFYYLGGFEPEMGKYSIGTLLNARAIQTAVSEQCTEFDFLRGNESYKYRWQPEVRLNQQVLLVFKQGGNSVLGKIGTQIKTLERSAEHSAKAFAERQAQRAHKPPPPDKEQS
jgi:CelD/BcsL family acetyltransferase involved in cellulose biosynthesis